MRATLTATDLIDPSRVSLSFTIMAATDVFAMSIGPRGFAGVTTAAGLAFSTWAQRPARIAAAA